MAINSEKNWMKNKLTLSKVKKIYKFLDNHRRGKVGAKALFFFIKESLIEFSRKSEKILILVVKELSLLCLYAYSAAFGWSV